MQGGPAGELAGEPGGDIGPGNAGVGREGGGIISCLKVGAQEVVLAVPVRTVRQAPVGVDGVQGVGAGGGELVVGGEVSLFG